MLLCRDDAHTIGIRILWGKCTTSAECKTIRIAVSAVMDMGKAVLGIRGRFHFTEVFSKKFWKSTWEVRKNTSGTGGDVPGRYGGKLVKLFWSF